MSLKIRLKRTGRHKDPHYRVVAVDSRKKRDGKVIDNIGHYHPTVSETVIDLKKIDAWVQNGAQMSDTVRTLVAKQRRNSGKEEK